MGTYKRIVLIALPNPTMSDQKIAPPLGLLYIAAYLKKFGYNNIEILNLPCEIENTDIAGCLNFLKDVEADIFGISIATTQLTYAEKICNYLKERNPQALVIIGGVHPTTLPEETLKITNADIAVIAEGEETFLEIVRGKSPEEIKGIAYKKDGEIINNGRRDYIKNLDVLPYPARELIDFSKYTRTLGGEPCTNLITARGCPFNCVFCDQDIWQRKVRYFSTEYVLGEVDDIKKKTGIDKLLFLDDTLTLNRERIIDIAKGLKKRSVEWRGWTRADTVDLELLKIMKEGGCQSLCIGAESGSDKILKNIKKGVTTEQNLQAVKWVKESEMMVRVSLIVGSPGETEETIEETKKFMVSAHPDDWIVSTFVPVVGSDAWRNPDRYGIKITAKSYDEFFVVGYDEESGSVMEYDNLSGNEILGMKKDLIGFLNQYVPRKPEEVVK